MIQRIFSSLLVAMIVLSLATVTFAQEKQEMKKEEPKKEAKTEPTKATTEMGPLKSVSCADECGFMIRSRDEKDVVMATKAHFKNMHKKDVTDKQVKDMMKTEPATMHN